MTSGTTAQTFQVPVKNRFILLMQQRPPATPPKDNIHYYTGPLRQSCLLEFVFRDTSSLLERRTVVGKELVHFT